LRGGHGGEDGFGEREREPIVRLAPIVDRGEERVARVEDDCEDVDDEFLRRDAFGACPRLSVERKFKKVFRRVLALSDDDLFAVQEATEAADDGTGEAVESDEI
jgi:hypothetical protein